MPYHAGSLWVSKDARFLEDDDFYKRWLIDFSFLDD